MTKYFLIKSVFCSSIFIPIIILFSHKANAQTFFSEDFESITAPALPAGWNSTTMDTSSLAGFFTGDQSAAIAGGTWGVDPHTNFALTNDDVCNCDASADYLILPPQDLSSYAHVLLSADVWNDNFWGGVGSVEVSTDAGTTWNTISVLPGIFGWEYTTIDLTPYSGAGFTNVLIAFRYNDGGSHAAGMAVDNVELKSVTSVEDVVAVSGGQYTQIPLNHLPTTFEGKAANLLGSTDISNVVLTVDVFDAATNMLITSTNSSPSTIVTGDTATFTAPVPTTLGLGDYLLKYSFSKGSSDLNPLNDTTEQQFSVTPSTFARDNGAPVGILSATLNFPAFQGHEIELNAPDNLESLDLAFLGGGIGDTIQVQVYDMLGGTPNALIATSSPIILDSVGTGGVSTSGVVQFNTYAFDSPVSLSPGKYVIGFLHRTRTSHIQLFYSNSIVTLKKSWVIRPETGPNAGIWRNLEDVNFFVSYLIRANMTSCTTSVNVSITDNMDGTATASSNNGVPPYTYVWSNGQTSETASNLTSGQYSVTSTDANGCSASMQITINSTNIELLENLKQVKVYPNPANRTVTVDLGQVEFDRISVKLSDITGKVITFDSYSARQQIEFNVEHLAEGVYMVELTADAQTVTKKLMIQH